MRKIPILFENNFCMVLNKPVGLPVQGGKGVKTSLDTILSEDFEPRPLLVHRLDRDTSGVILVAKTKEAAAALSALLGSDRSIAKRYLGVCAGVPDEAAGAIRLDLDVRGKEKEAETFYRLVKTAACKLPDGRDFSCSLLELELGTGRIHQLRRHLALVGHPLLGDDKYGDFPLNKSLQKTFGLKRLLLHASRLVIPPSPGLLPDGLDVSAPLPEHFEKVTVTFFDIQV